MTYHILSGEPLQGQEREMTHHILFGVRPFCQSIPSVRQQVMDLCRQRGRHYPPCSSCHLEDLTEDARLISEATGQGAVVVKGECPEDIRVRSMANLSEDGIEAAL